MKAAKKKQIGKREPKKRSLESGQLKKARGGGTVAPLGDVNAIATVDF